MRLIDADKIIKDVEEAKCEKKGSFTNGIPYEWAWTLTVLGAQPTINPESLRPTAKWVYNTDDFTPKKRCTHCGYNKPIAAGEAIHQEPSNYCPNCGVCMKGAETDA